MRFPVSFSCESPQTFKGFMGYVLFLLQLQIEMILVSNWVDACREGNGHFVGIELESCRKLFKVNSGKKF